MSHPAHLVINNESQLEAFNHVLSSDALRVISTNHDEKVIVQPISPDTCDALRVSRFEIVAPVGTFLHQAVRSAVQMAQKKGHIADFRNKTDGPDSVEYLTKIFLEGSEQRDLHIAQNRYEYLAYIERDMDSWRFVAQDVAEQLMLYKRDHEGGYLIVNEFLQYCRKNNVLGDVPLALMVHKLYRRKERPVVLASLHINQEMVAEIEHLFMQGGLRDKQKALLSLSQSSRVTEGKFDKAFLSLTNQRITKSIVFTFKSLYGVMFQKIQSDGMLAASREEIDERVAEEASQMEDAPQELLVITNPRLTNVIIPKQRSWLQHAVNLYPSTILEEIFKYYEMGFNK